MPQSPQQTVPIPPNATILGAPIGSQREQLASAISDELRQRRTRQVATAPSEGELVPIPAGATIAGMEPEPVATISALHEPTTIRGKVEKWASDLRTDLLQGTDRTLPGRILRAMGARGLESGTSPETARFMGSWATGPTRVLEGAAQQLQSGKRWQGTKNLVGGALETATIPASFAAPEIAEGATAAASRLSPGARMVRRLSNLKSEVAAIHGRIRGAEESAHAAASSAFPKIQTPVVLQTAKGAKQVAFRRAQEMRSNLLKDIAAESRAVAAGRTPRFQIEKLSKKLDTLDTAMSDAASAEGKLDQLQAARQKFAAYMSDWHNRGSAVKPLLDMKSDETARIVSRLTNPNAGPRIVETLERHGADTSAIRDLLKRSGLGEDVKSAAQLRSIGPDAVRRLQIERALKKYGKPALKYGAIGLGAEEISRRKLLPHLLTVRIGGGE